MNQNSGRDARRNQGKRRRGGCEVGGFTEKGLGLKSSKHGILILTAGPKVKDKNEGVVDLAKNVQSLRK